MNKRVPSYPSCSIKSPTCVAEEAELFSKLKRKQLLRKLDECIDNLLIKEDFSAPLNNNIKTAYNKLVLSIENIPIKDRLKKTIEGTGGKVCIADLIAYQIGWGRLLLSWYKAEMEGKEPQMPGEGFKTWDYIGLAKLFYKKYRFDASNEQILEFYELVGQILLVVEKEFKNKNLSKLGVFDWCTLPSGKDWSLEKWITVNTVSPYRRAYALIAKYKAGNRL